MTTTTGDPSSLKTPASLSGGDLVSRLLAATPPYLYNVPLTPHSFFFSEMLRSFVQSKADASTSGTGSGSGSVVRRRKRSWRDSRERPLELTTKEKPQNNPGNGVNHLPQHSHHHHHHHHHHQQQQQQPQHFHQRGQQKDKYYGIQHQTQQSLQRASPTDVVNQETRYKSHNNGGSEESSHYGNDGGGIKRVSNYERRTSPYSVNEPLKSTDDNNRPDFCKQARDFYDDSSRRFSTEQSAHRDALFAAATLKVKPEDSSGQRIVPGESKQREDSPDRTSTNDDRANISSQESSFLVEQKNKIQEFTGRNFLPGLSGIDEQSKALGLTGVPNSTDFLPSGPMWYPPYPTIPQSYPGIDPLHFFIDLRVSGHIWDRKINERQIPFKSKHCSAFSVPQAKEYNRPLDLTRDEATASSNSLRNTSNQRGTHYILRHLSDTYKDIREKENVPKNPDISSTNVSTPDDNTNDCQGKSLSKSDISASSSSSRETRQQKDEENEGKDLRALIGLELVVDYVKEPKENVTIDEPHSPDVGE